jgi:hypothetical protein
MPVLLARGKPREDSWHGENQQPMTTSIKKIERTSIGLVLTVALLMFFSPLMTTTSSPLVAEDSVPAYGVQAKLSQLQFDLERASVPASQGASRAASSGAPTETSVELRELDLPFSLRTPWLPSVLIYIAFGLAGLALLDLLLFQKLTAILSFAAGCFGVLALVNVLMISSDLGTWMVTLMTSGALGSLNDPGASVRLLTNGAFRLHAGPGLYSLTSCLLLAAFFSQTAAIPRVRGVLRGGKRTKVSQPMRIRPAHGDLPEESTTTLDVSQGGLSFASAAGHYYVGMEVFLKRDAISGAPATLEERGSVVRVEEMESGKRRVAVRIISPV